VSVYQPDKEHLHHRLLQLGHGHRRAVVILWAWTAVLSAVVLVPTYTGKGNAAVLPLMAGLGVVLYTLFHPDVRRGAQLTALPGGNERRPRGAA
jgi:UDP-GlcNAc:undecaprenyl-phosphate GlcNAc-1-phosphate transferase